MGQAAFDVIKPGLSTTIQDLGRTGYQQYGVVVSGAMDEFALRVSNLLVGNKQDEATLEVIIMGPKFRLLTDTVLSICGADLSPKLDGEDIPLWKRVPVKKGQILSFGQPKNGAYAYIAVAGGIEVPTVMESRSTYTKAAIGGIEGRALQKGDQIKMGIKEVTPAGIGVSSAYIPKYGSGKRIRVILGPDQGAFDQASMTRFLSEKYKVSTQSDRMGSRLEGPALSFVNGPDIISDAILPGAIQVPANGQPIVLLADRQTAGGYARIATVISTDLPYVAQLLPGSELSFEAVAVEEAQRLYVEREKFLSRLSVGVGV